MEYEPDDSGLTLEGLAYLEANPALMTEAEAVREVTPADITRLRKQWPADMVRMALVVAEARRKAKKGGKFEPIPKLWGTPEAVEQATSTRVARHKASRIEEYLRARGHSAMSNAIWDFFAGIGGDAFELARVSLVTAIEMSPVRAHCLSKNCGPRVVAHCIEVDAKLSNVAARFNLAGIKETGVVFHCDPARRSGGTRRHGWDEMIPGPQTINALIELFAGGAIKLSPAVDFSSLPAGEVEVISTDGSVVQAVLWVGGLQRAPRSATVMRGQSSITISGEPGGKEAPSPAEKFIYEIDGAVHRAGLAQNLTRELGLQWLSTDGGYVTAEKIVEHLALTRFMHIETIAYSEKKLIEALRKLPPIDRAVEIKTRGGLDINTDDLQVQMTKAASCGATVLIYPGKQASIAASICMRENC